MRLTSVDLAMLTALLVDDEPLASVRLRELLALHPTIEVVGAATSLAAARVALEARPPDVVFLDVEMPGGNGFDLLASVPDTTQVVFVTARATYAVQAFAAAALDYLVKPVDPERLADTVARLQRQAAAAGARLEEGRSADESAPDAAAAAGHVLGLGDLVSVPLVGKTQSATLKVGDIRWIESLRNYTRVALVPPARLMLFRRRLSHWDTLLPESAFARVGRSYIVQIGSIDLIEWSSRHATVVTFGTGVEPLALGRLPATRLREILGGG